MILFLQALALSAVAHAILLGIAWKIRKRVVQ